MTRRHRRASTSSVETVDESRILYRQESSVLRSVPKLTDTNDWPIFELRDAVVLDKDGQKMENALHVGIRPFIVRGELVIDDAAQKQHLIMRVRTSIPIEIRHFEKYSIGELANGQPLIWVSGKGGWYEITPSPKYLPIYTKMCEAAAMYYRIMDIYKTRKIRKAKRSKSGYLGELAPIFHQYAARVGDGSTLEEVVDRCAEHAPFFLTQFAQEDTNEFDWSQTTFYKWMVAEHGHILVTAKEPASDPMQVDRPPSVEVVETAPPKPQSLPTRTRTGSSIPTTSRRQLQPDRARLHSTPQRSSRSRSASHLDNDKDVKSETSTLAELPAEDSAVTSAADEPTAPTGPPVPPSIGADEPPFATVLAAFEHVYDLLVNVKHGMTVTATMSKLYFAYRFPNYRNGTVGSYKIPIYEVLHYNAGQLLQTIDHAKFEKFEIFSWLQEHAKKPFDPVAIARSDFPYRVVPRAKISRASKKDNIPLPGSGADDDASSINTQSSLHAGKGLRLTGSRGGKRSGLRLAISSKKRPHSELETGSDSEETEPKKSHYFTEEDEAMETGEDDSSEVNNDSDEAEPIKIILRAEKIPSTVPHGPHETWTCDEEDCSYVVRGGDAEQCQHRIRQHFESHEARNERLSLAMTESTRGHMPINHLIEKLKKMGGKSQAVQQLEQLALDGELLPPIKRKLYV